MTKKWRLTSGHGFAPECGANHDSDVNAAKNIKSGRADHISPRSDCKP
uniref:Transposase n=1 Tax=Klebsiella pneumoniae TaxID=573 RepID=A0A8B0SS00_KLEPN|nr:hypothetical protein [Klebsiella pneumoniae]